MKRLTTSILLFLIVLGHSIQAQNSAAQAKNLLEDVSSKIKSYSNIAIDFKYSVQNGMTLATQDTRGNITLEGDKYYLNVLGITRIYDGKTLYTINPEDEEVTISSNNTDSVESITPEQMLSFYDSGYTYDMDITQNINGRKIQYVKLTPTDSGSGIKHVLLGIDSNTHHIYKLIEVANDGGNTTLTVNSFKTDELLSKSLFIFDESKYSGYFINRLD